MTTVQIHRPEQGSSSPGGHTFTDGQHGGTERPMSVGEAMQRPQQTPTHYPPGYATQGAQPHVGHAPAPTHQPHSPTSQVLAHAPQPVTVYDSRGRAITIRKFNPIDRMRLLKILGPQLAENQQYVNYATLAATVVSIDGQAEGAQTERQLEFLAERLGDEGFAAIADAYQKNFGLNSVGETADPATIKNS